MTDPVPAQHAADAWQQHRPVLEALSAELARHDPILARSLEGAMQIRDAILVGLVGRHVAEGAEGDLRELGQKIEAEAHAIGAPGDPASQAGGR